jgi:hypothetical protein
MQKKYFFKIFQEALKVIIALQKAAPNLNIEGKRANYLILSRKDFWTIH